MSNRSCPESIELLRPVARGGLGGLFPLLIFAPLLIIAGCQGDGDRIPLDRSGSGQGSVNPLPAEIQVRVDSANAAYRARDYEGALEIFTRVAELAPDLAVGWYGKGMTHSAMGNQAAADSAMMRAHRLAPEIPMDHPGPAPLNPHPMNPHGLEPEGGDSHMSPPRQPRGYEGDGDSGA